MKKQTLAPLLLCLAFAMPFSACTAPPASSQAPSPPVAAPESVSRPAVLEAASLPPAQEAAVSDSSDTAKIVSLDAQYDTLQEAGLPAELITLYQDARSLYLENMGPDWMEGEPVIGFTPWEQEATVEVDGIPYTQLDGQFSTLKELTGYFYSIFTPEYADELMGVNTPLARYVEVDGRLYGTYGGRGYRVDYTGQPDLYGPVLGYTDESGLECVSFDVIGQYKGRETGEYYTEGLPITMKLTKNGWRVSEFSLTY